MQDAEVRELLEDLRAFGTDISAIEAKKADGGLPRSVRESMSAFANTVGGVLVFGVDESAGFRVTGLTNPAKMSADLASACSDEMEPCIRPLIGLHEIEGETVLIAEIPELDPGQKPCFYKGAGMNRGSYVRVGDGDRPLSSYEVQMLVCSRGQPRDDEHPIVGISIEALDSDLVQRFARRLRETRQHVFGDKSDAEVLRMVKVLVPDGDDGEAVSVAGLLALGRFPQHSLPQLNLTFVHYPTTDGVPLATGERFLDNVALDGPVPVIVRDALAALRRNMTRRSVVRGAGRQDVSEYPEEALREVLVNALVHRDVSPQSRGTQVQVEMYPDRLVVRNAGGLFGPVSLENLGEDGVSSARNATLMKILEDVPLPNTDRTVCENRGTGVRTMVHALRTAGMTPPRFVDRIATFEVTFPNHTLMSDSVVQWINALGQRGLTDSEHVGLALMRDGNAIDNPTYRAATGVDSRVATAELQDLVARELAQQTGSRRWARYTLSPRASRVDPSAPGSNRLAPADRRSDILSIIGTGDLSRAEISARSGLPGPTVRHWLAVLRQEGRIRIVGDGAAKSPNTRYRVEPTIGQEPLF